MFGEPMDSILAVVAVLWLLGSMTVVPVLYLRRIGLPRAFRDAVDTSAAWVNRATVGVVWVLLVAYSIEITYARWGTWALVAAGIYLCLVLLAPVGAKMKHKQESDTDAAGDRDGDPGVDGSPSNKPD